MNGHPHVSGPRPVPLEHRWPGLVLLVMLASTAACQPFAEALRGKLLPAGEDQSPTVSDHPLADLFSSADLPSPSGNIELMADHKPRRSTPKPTAKASYTLLGVDCFGETPEGSCERFREMAGLKERQRLPMGWTGNGAADRIRRSGPYAQVSLSPVFYPDGSAYVTIDVVTQTQQDMLRLRPAPVEDVAMGSNLLDIYAQFTQRWFALFSKGIKVNSQPRAGYWDYPHARLQPFVELFRQEVPGQRLELQQVLLFDSNPHKRQAAANLLGFDKDDVAVVEALSLAMLDPEPTVRSAAARAIQPKIQRLLAKGAVEAIPTQHALHMLHLPSTSDRSGASALLAEMIQVPELRQPILNTAFPILVQMVAATAPGNQGKAVEVLEGATGLKYGRDARRWKELSVSTTQRQR